MQRRKGAENVNSNYFPWETKVVRAQKDMIK